MEFYDNFWLLFARVFENATQFPRLNVGYFLLMVEHLTN